MTKKQVTELNEALSYITAVSATKLFAALERYDDGKHPDLIPKLFDLICEAEALNKKTDYLIQARRYFPDGEYNKRLRDLNTQIADVTNGIKSVISREEDGFTAHEIPKGRVEHYDGPLEESDSQWDFKMEAWRRSERARTNYHCDE